jgi:hypothetical protein
VKSVQGPGMMISLPQNPLQRPKPRLADEKYTLNAKYISLQGDGLWTSVEFQGFQLLLEPSELR